MLPAKPCSLCVYVYIWRASGQLVECAVAAILDLSGGFWQQCQGWVPLGSVTAQTARTGDVQLNWGKWVITAGCLHPNKCFSFLATACFYCKLSCMCGTQSSFYVLFSGINLHLTHCVLQVICFWAHTASVEAHFTRQLQTSLVYCSHLHSRSPDCLLDVDDFPCDEAAGRLFIWCIFHVLRLLLRDGRGGE